MAIGESLFDIVYLLYVFLVFLGIKNHYNKKEINYIKYAALLLFLGDACHLIPRILNYFIDYDFTLFLGLGKLATSITMTLFYYLLYKTFNKKDNMLPLSLVVLRVGLCLLPGNGWFANNGKYIFAITRNIPFVILGILVLIEFYKNRGNDNFGNIWLLITLSFLFYLPVVLGASFMPILGMFMIPKTICYIGIISKLYGYTKLLNKKEVGDNYGEI